MLRRSGLSRTTSDDVEEAFLNVPEVPYARYPAAGSAARTSPDFGETASRGSPSSVASSAAAALLVGQSGSTRYDDSGRLSRGRLEDDNEDDGGFLRRGGDAFGRHPVTIPAFGPEESRPLQVAGVLAASSWRVTRPPSRGPVEDSGIILTRSLSGQEEIHLRPRGPRSEDEQDGEADVGVIRVVEGVETSRSSPLSALTPSPSLTPPPEAIRAPVDPIHAPVPQYNTAPAALGRVVSTVRATPGRTRLSRSRIWQGSRPTGGEGEEEEEEEEEMVGAGGGGRGRGGSGDDDEDEEYDPATDTSAQFPRRRRRGGRRRSAPHSSSSKGKGWYPCELCPKRYRNVADLTDHITSRHEHKKHPCLVCEVVHDMRRRRYASRSKLRTHVRDSHLKDGFHDCGNYNDVVNYFARLGYFPTPLKDSEDVRRG